MRKKKNIHTLRSAVMVCIYAVSYIDWKDSGTDRLEIKAGFLYIKCLTQLGSLFFLSR